MVPRENKNDAYAKFGGTNKEYYGVFRTGLYTDIMRFLAYYVHITKCLPHTKYKQYCNQYPSPKLQGTPYDTLWRL